MGCRQLASSVKVLVRWATGKRVSNRLPKLSLLALSPGTDRIYGSTCHQYVVPISGGPVVFFRFLTCGKKIRFSFKSVFVVDVRFELTTNDPWSVDDAIYL